MHHIVCQFYLCSAKMYSLKKSTTLLEFKSVQTWCSKQNVNFYLSHAPQVCMLHMIAYLHFYWNLVHENVYFSFFFKLLHSLRAVKTVYNFSVLPFFSKIREDTTEYYGMTSCGKENCRSWLMDYKNGLMSNIVNTMRQILMLAPHGY